MQNVALALMCILFVLCLYMLVEVMLFRLACRIADVPEPLPARTWLIIFSTNIVGFGSASLVAGVVERIYSVGGFPLWEVSLVGAFVEMPIHMVLISSIHAKLAGLKMPSALAVWFVEKSIKLSMFGIIGLAVGSIYLAQRWLF